MDRRIAWFWGMVALAVVIWLVFGIHGLLGFAIVMILMHLYDTALRWERLDEQLQELHREIERTQSMIRSTQ